MRLSLRGAPKGLATISDSCLAILLARGFACAIHSMKAGLCEALADLESYCPREFSLMLIEAVKVVRSEFESRRNMQQVRRTGPQASRGSTGQLAGPLKDLLWKRAQEKDTSAHIFLEVTQ